LYKEEELMNRRQSVFSLFIPKGKGQVVGLGKMSALVIGLSALVLATFVAAPGDVAAADIAYLATDSKLVSTHCSLELGGNYDTLTVCWSEAMAVNPELTVTSRYVAPAVEQGAEVAYLAANPELMVARRYVSSAQQVPDSAFLATNPELMAVSRYVGSAEQVIDSAYLAANPELMAARR
jgi:hypothetical protein